MISSIARLNQKHLILQVLGNSDIRVRSDKGYETLESVSNLEDIKFKVEGNEEDFKENQNSVKFPLIEQLKNSRQQNFSDAETLWGIILTDQTEWMQARITTGSDWSKVIARDGIWWDKILSQWCQQKSLNYYPIYLKLAAEKADEPKYNGVADWEKMAEVIRPLLSQYLTFNQENKEIEFRPSENAEPIKIDKIIIQHSSGTPALSSALYLWGIERKLVEKEKIEFVYISEQELEPLTHQGSYWQWRMKDSQIRELLKIQDFSGARVLLDKEHKNYQQLSDQLEFLDESISLNLTTRGLRGREAVIERISIAVWSEKAFRDRSHWMHWYFRITGAFELALLLLLEKHGNGDYQWKNRKLIFKDDNRHGEVARCGIKEIVERILTLGQFNHVFFNHTKEFTASPIQDTKWKDFKCFYLDNWQLENSLQEKLGFNSVRNQLYHSLMGDRIDNLLDKRTQELKQIDHPDHPAQVAIDWLEYIINLSGESQQVQERANFYNQKVQNIKDLLE